MVERRRRKNSKLHRMYLLLLWNEGRAVQHATIVDVLWGGDEDGGPFNTTDIVRIYIRMLRARYPDRLFVSLPGYGYRLEIVVPPAEAV